LVASTGANGFCLKPLIVILRKSGDPDLALTGITDKKVDVYSQKKDYTDRSIFLAWLTDLFLAEVVRRRQAFAYQRRVILILDNCTAHTGSEIDEVCAAHGLAKCPLPPHSSNQFSRLMC
jgi:hypothetical protein